MSISFLAYKRPPFAASSPGTSIAIRVNNGLLGSDTACYMQCKN